MSKLYKEEFLKILLHSNALKFGDYVTKSKRKTPYFFDFGKISTGKYLSKLANIYATHINENFPEAENIFGPAYKGISLVVSTAIKFNDNFNKNISFTFNRKEAKQHGEKGMLVGHSYNGNEKVIIVEDVITGGTSMRDMYPLLNNNKVNTIGLVVGIDRCEKGKTQKTAKSEIEELYAAPLKPILDIFEIVKILHNSTFMDKVWIDDNRYKSIEAYWDLYTVNSN